MIRREGDTLVVEGPVTLATVSDALKAGLSLLTNDVVAVDLSRVTESDSSSIAMLLEWVRSAHGRHMRLEVRNAGESISSLATLYGVDELLLVRG